MSQYCSRIDNDCPVWDEEDPGNALDVLRRENGKLRNHLASMVKFVRTFPLHPSLKEVTVGRGRHIDTNTESRENPWSIYQDLANHLQDFIDVADKGHTDTERLDLLAQRTIHIPMLWDDKWYVSLPEWDIPGCSYKTKTFEDLREALDCGLEQFEKERARNAERA